MHYNIVIYMYMIPNIWQHARYPACYTFILLGFHFSTSAIHSFALLTSNHRHQGYTKPREYIVTEWPLKHTVGEFWSLVYDQECSAVVVLLQPPPNSVRTIMPAHIGIVMFTVRILMRVLNIFFSNCSKPRPHIRHFGRKRAKWKSTVRYFRCTRYRANTSPTSSSGSTRSTRKYVGH